MVFSNDRKRKQTLKETLTDCLISGKSKVDKDIELQKIQALDSYFQAWFNTGASIWVGGFLALLIFILTLYYEGKFDIILTLITVFAVYAILGYSGMNMLPICCNRP